MAQSSDARHTSGGFLCHRECSWVFGCWVRAMTATVTATVTAPTMILGGEDHRAKFVRVEVRRCLAGCNLLTDARKDLRWLVLISRVTCQRSEAATIRTGRLGLFLGQETQNVRWNIGLVAPAQTFVKATIANAAIICRATDRTKPISCVRRAHHASEPPVWYSVTRVSKKFFS